MAFIQCDFYSEALGLSCNMNVLLPQETQSQIGMKGKAPEGDPPVLYLLHGMSDDHTIWMRRTSIERYAAPLGLAVIMPAVHRSHYIDMYRGYKYGQFVGEELPRICQKLFRIASEREKTFVAGLSMGGYGAFKLALAQPERFAAAASLSGVLDLGGHRDERPDRQQEYENILGPRDRFAGSPHDLFHLAEQLVSSGRPQPKLYQCCGTQDYLYPGNLKFRDFARKKGLDLTYEEGPGQHNWAYWDQQIQRVLDWLPL